ncbi:MAG: radical SAM protein [Candidatus Bathyarchaeia archaeon]
MNRPLDIGTFYTPRKVAESLISLAKKCKLDLLRLSGGEPTIGKQHLLQLLENLDGKGYRFILETNGILIASDEGYAESLAKYTFIHVRVSLKGCSEEEFSLLTGAKHEGFTLQLKALEKLVNAKMSCHPSVMASFSSKKSLQFLIERIGRISPRLAEEIEIEELILYPHVVQRLRNYKLRYYTGYAPERVPPEQV